MSFRVSGLSVRWKSTSSSQGELSPEARIEARHSTIAELHIQSDVTSIKLHARLAQQIAECRSAAPSGWCESCVAHRANSPLNASAPSSCSNPITVARAFVSNRTNEQACRHSQAAISNSRWPSETATICPHGFVFTPINW